MGNVGLTEHEYFDFFNAPTSLFNYTFLHLLREYSCLFIGLSMQDDNIRRLLHYSKQERVRALLDEGKSWKKADSKTLRHFAVLKRSESGVVDRLTESSLKRLGTRTLWISDYGEISLRLADMYEVAGKKWKWANVE